MTRPRTPNGETLTHIRGPYVPFAPEIAQRAAEIARRPYRKVVSGDADDGFLIEVPDLPGCVTAGETMEEAVGLLPDAMLLWIGTALEDGHTIPEPSAASEYSGKVLVRMPKTLHKRLIERAEAEGVSANQLAVSLLAQGL